MSQSSSTVVPRRLSPRWPPFTVHPKRDGLDDFAFVITGRTGLLIGTIALTIAIAISMCVAWMWSILSPSMMKVGLGLLVILAVSLWCALSYRVKAAIDLRTETIVITKSALGIAWSAFISHQALAIEVAKVALVRSGQIGGPWEGHGVFIVGNGRVLFALVMTKNFEDVERYLVELPTELQTLVRENDKTFVARL